MKKHSNIRPYVVRRHFLVIDDHNIINLHDVVGIEYVDEEDSCVISMGHDEEHTFTGNQAEKIWDWFLSDAVNSYDIEELRVRITNKDLSERY